MHRQHRKCTCFHPNRKHNFPNDSPLSISCKTNTDSRTPASRLNTGLALAKQWQAAHKLFSGGAPRGSRFQENSARPLSASQNHTTNRPRIFRSYIISSRRCSAKHANQRSPKRSTGPSRAVGRAGNAPDSPGVCFGEWNSDCLAKGRFVVTSDLHHRWKSCWQWDASPLSENRWGFNYGMGEASGEKIFVPTLICKSWTLEKLGVISIWINIRTGNLLSVTIYWFLRN